MFQSIRACFISPHCDIFMFLIFKGKAADLKTNTNTSAQAAGLLKSDKKVRKSEVRPSSAATNLCQNSDNSRQRAFPDFANSTAPRTAPHAKSLV